MNSTLLKKGKKTLMLPVMEAFHTIQGEGFHQGKSAYFIRLAGCDVGCHWCDVKESWDAEKHPQVDVKDIVNDAALENAPIAVITGGEPLMHNLDQLTSELKEVNFATHIETSGTHPLTGSWDWICFSPKKFKKPLPVIYQKANELKIVIYNRNDFKWAEEHAERVNEHCHLFLQPEWSKRKEMTPLIVDYIKRNPRWQISLQVHKYMNIP
jgi:7-carboxy-7-deazaguanine synthase